ncbi:MAG TPA: YceD family protein [Burkholderiaceae bacterium]|nr:YceD family protein [Burkholderiaceae bacterium]
MKTEFDAARLDIRAFAQTGGALTGQDPLQKYARLMQEVLGAAGDFPVSWSAQGEQRKVAGQTDEVWLHLQADAMLPLTCQRCLARVDVPLAVENSFRFVTSEAAAAAEDDTSEEDVLVLARDFDLNALIEDELLMEMPVVPRHDVCPTEVKMEAVDADFDATEQAKPNPFAVLAKLQGGKSG